MHQDQFYFSKYDGTKRFSQQDIHSAKATGFSAASDDYAERGIDLNEELVYNKPATFFMRVNSDALKESGIHKEDIVIVDRSLRPGNGKVIIAIFNGDMLIRRYEKINNNIRLLADSQKLAAISIDNTCEEFEIWGVVTYVIHKP
jgi:DNA polymerase V